MKASEMVSIIKTVEKECIGLDISAKRISLFQSENLPVTQEVEYDMGFYDFVKEMESVMQCKIYIPTAKKILNNWYLWAKSNLEALSKVEPFVDADNAIDWLMKNNFRIDHKCFAKDATDKLIEKVKEQIPQDSELYAKLKSTADKTYTDEIGKRGFSYPYLVKVVAGFSEAWE